MRLEDIGFYTLCDARCQQIGNRSPMWRCEMLVTDRCNFKCPYCRPLRTECRGDISFDYAVGVINQWGIDGLKNIRFSGGEPLLYEKLPQLVTAARMNGIQRIAISTNGSLPFNEYFELIGCGVNDFSVSLDACCAADCGTMSGGCAAAFKRIPDNIRELSKLTYVTVGVVLTEVNAPKLAEIVQYAHDLGVADIRIIPAAQCGAMIEGVEAIPDEILAAHPILNYRVTNIKQGRPVRGIDDYDSDRCFIPVDDSVVAGRYHFPCIIYLREGGDPVGTVNDDMRRDRIQWSKQHRPQDDPICRTNCLDVCVDHNNVCAYNCGLLHPGVK